MAGNRYKDEKFVGWLKVNLSLIFAKEGVEQFSDDEVQTFHDNIKHNIPSSSAPGRQTCTQSKHLWLGGIRKNVLLNLHGSPKSVNWDNFNLAELSTHPWACAKLFMPYGSASYTQASDADIASLLTLFLRCVHFRKFFNQVDVCQKVKDIRNRMMHTCKMEVDAASVTAYTTQIIEFLEDPKHLLHQPPCQEAVRKIKELLSGKTEISLNKELELRVLNTELRYLVDVVKALGSKAKDTGADVASNTEDLKTLKTELALVKSRSEDFSQFITDYKIKGVSAEKLSEVSNKIARLENNVQAELHELTDQVEKLKIQGKTLTTEQSGQKQRLAALELGHSAVSQEQGNQEQRLDQLETGHSTVSQEQGSQRQRIDQLETGMLDISQEQGSQRQRLDQLETTVSQEQGSQRQRLDQLETTVSQEQRRQRQRLDQLETTVSQEQGSQGQKLDQLETTVSQEQGSQRQRLHQLEKDLSDISQEQQQLKRDAQKVDATPRLVVDNQPSPAERLLRQPTADQILQASNMQSTRAKRNGGKQNQNLKFYKNELSSKPAPGSTIKDMLRWKGDYKFLEEHGYYMHWLFPIPDTTGVNEHAQPLCPHEIQAIRGDKTIQHRFLGAYKMMLDLYGLQLSSERNGTVCHAANWSRRYAFLDSSKKAHKQITRIIKALESFGFQHFQQPLVCFLLNETFSERRLNIPVESFQVWISMMADDNEKIACVTIMDELVGT